MALRVGINGFGRIGRTFYRAVRRRDADIDVVAVNDLGDPKHIAQLLAFDSVAGPLDAPVHVNGSSLHVGDDVISLLARRTPGELRWGDLGVDVVLEATRMFSDRDRAAGHLEAGAAHVVVTAPAKGADATFVVGVNEHEFDPDRHRVVSNASCTTNCLVPMVKVLDEAFGFQTGLMTTVHAYTSDQNLVDGPSDDPRRGRAAAINIVPAASGAARATSLVMGEVGERLDGAAVRVPVPDGSLTDLTAILQTSVDVAQVNAAFRAASEGPLAGIVDYSEAPLVSSDIIGRSASCTYDAGLTVIQGPLVKVFGWYDNEWGYSNRLIDLVEHIASTSRHR